MLVHRPEMRGPMAAFNARIIVQPDMIIADERAIPADIAPTVIDALGTRGLYTWIYRAAQWYVTDPDAPHAAREAETVQFQPPVVPGYDGPLNRTVTIVGVNDDHGYPQRRECPAQRTVAGNRRT